MLFQQLGLKMAALSSAASGAQLKLCFNYTRAGFFCQAIYYPISMIMPALFIGHGSPMNAVQDTAYSRAWKKAAGAIPRPESILFVSAHWETAGVAVTGGARPPMIYDFMGFPEELYAVTYPAPGLPTLAARVGDLLGGVRAEERGYDHGVWSILRHMYPRADVPVVQLSLNRNLSAAGHYELAKKLAPLRREGVLIMGSGNIVHNLRLLRQGPAYPWAQEMDQKVAEAVAASDHESLIHYEKWGETARLSVQGPEHFWPLLYVLAVRDKNEPASFVTEGLDLGAISMRSVRIG
jgi:4,5-DOPA dioxygenase extradiol